MRVLVVGGGPAGLYFAGLFKRSFPDAGVTVLERRPRGATYGFGVVLSDAALSVLGEADPASRDRIAEAAETWRDLAIVHRGDRVAIDGNGFSGIARTRLLEILEDFAESAGVELRHGTAATLDALDGPGLVVGADGAGSAVRAAREAEFGRETQTLDNRYVWYGVARPFDTLTLTFRAGAEGHFVAHHYRYAPDMSTFIVECDAATYRRAGFARMTDAESRARCERLFAPELDGRPLVSNASKWRRFPVARVRRWSAGNAVLLGDARASVHFSIGSGTRMALEDAIALWRAFRARPGDVPAALAAFEAARRPASDRLLAAAAGSYRWYEDLAGRMALDPMALARDYMTRGGRIDDARLRAIAPRFMRDYDASRGAAA